MSKSGVLLLFLSLTSLIGLSQEAEPDTSRYFVYFNDKSAEDYPYSLSSPEEFLTQKSIDRRTKQNIAIKESDLPVAPSYIEALRNQDIEVFFTSRWLNGALIQTHNNKIEEINSLTYVDSVRLIASNSRLRFSQQQVSTPTQFDPPPNKNGDSDIQLLMIGADVMHNDDIKGQNMLIAVLDNGFTGVNRFSPFQHVWENNRIVGTKDFVENSGNVYQYGSHGTSVLSIIGAKYETDTTDLIGVAYEADFILCVTEDNQAENTIEEYNWLLGAEFADSLGADVINASLGYKTFDIPEHNYASTDLDGNTAIVSIAAHLAAQKGMIVVTSAGNSGRRSAPGNLISHPSDADGIMTVASVDPDFTRSDFSSIGPTTDGRIKPDIAAFGNGTAVMRGNGNIERGGGTSFASPLIAGFAACIWQINPDRTSHEIMTSIRESAHQSTDPDFGLGYGVPNYLYAREVRALNVNDILENKVTVYPNPFSGDTLFIKTKGKFKSGMTIRVVDPRGAEVFNKEFKRSQIKETMELSIDSSQQGVYYLFLQSGKDQKIVKLINF